MGAADPGGDAGQSATADARPVHRVYVDGFWMDSTPVTNEAFAKFVRATSYVTAAERTPSAEDFPETAPESLVAGSVVFDPPRRPAASDSRRRLWRYTRGANWQHPSGPASDLRGRQRCPVVQVAYDDAVAYCRWAKKRLPTEAEFEFAARGGLSGKPYPWGDEARPGDRWMANLFEGHFPDNDTGDDGWVGIAPVASYPPNGYGLYDVAGNVWEWVSDWYRSDYYESFDLHRTSRNPRGPEDSHDPSAPGVAERVQRGGSYLCASDDCTQYLVGARGKGDPLSGANLLGFRCIAPDTR
jgi:formylglycine-generating enzyme required for sulfatase activity